MNETILGRRQLLGGAALLTASAILPATLAGAAARSRVRTRATGPVEVLYKTPHFGPNGMWMSPEGMWIIHQIDENYATLIDIDTGKVLREIRCEGVVRASGICIDEQGVMWIASTYNRLIIACDATTGKAIAKYSTPGAGQIYAMKGDVRGSRSPLQPAYPPPPPAGPSGRRGAGKQDLSTTEGPVGTGAQLHRGFMYMCDDVGWMSRVRI
jgi:outer membrane protein assembly factor BamB